MVSVDMFRSILILDPRRRLTSMQTASGSLDTDQHNRERSMRFATCLNPVFVFRAWTRTIPADTEGDIEPSSVPLPQRKI